MYISHIESIVVKDLFNAEHKSLLSNKSGVQLQQSILNSKFAVELVTK